MVSPTPLSSGIYAWGSIEGDAMSDEQDPTPFLPMSPQVPASSPDPSEHRPAEASAVPPPPVPVGPAEPASAWAAESGQGTGTSPAGVLAPPRPHPELGSDR